MSLISSIMINDDRADEVRWAKNKETSKFPVMIYDHEGKISACTEITANEAIATGQATAMHTRR